MSLKDVPLDVDYRGNSDRLLEEFFNPCLAQSCLYQRAVGFFSSTSMAIAARGLKTLIRAGGRMQLVTSPHLSKADVAAIESGLRSREEVIAETLTQALENDFEEVVYDRLACLAWLLSQGLLDIKLAISTNLFPHSIYHEKLGIFSDTVGNSVVFTGSANESAAGLFGNYESVDVFCSWKEGDRVRVARKLTYFESLWSNNTEGLDVVGFPEAARRSLLRFRPERSPAEMEDALDLTAWSERKGQYRLPTREIELSTPPIPRFPDCIRLRDYQQQAVENWFANNGRGTLKMATGSGKTITALAIVAKLYRDIELKVLVVVCPYRHLVSQWAKECRTFGLKPLLAFESAQTWQEQLATQLYNVRSGSQQFLTVVTTNATLMGERFQTQLQYVPPKTLIVGDEAHNFGARRLEECLPRNIGLRLGLSATPERFFDDSGTQRIFDYFGPVLEPEFTLRDAIRAGALVRYRYYPMLVELTEREAEEYRALTGKIGRCIGLDGADTDENEALTALLVRRSRLVGSASNKLEVLRELMQGRVETSHTLFYCGDGEVEDEVTAETRRQVEAVTRLLGKELGYRVNTYTAETSLEERELLRQQFESGELQGLVAIRCLDEGVDIPATKTAVILASSSNPRQFIQRRGRILRRYPGKDRATLFDAIVVPPEMGEGAIQVEQGLLRKELRRFAEFADLADNAGEARAHLLPLQKQYGLLDL